MDVNSAIAMVLPLLAVAGLLIKAGHDKARSDSRLDAVEGRMSDREEERVREASDLRDFQEAIRLDHTRIDLRVSQNESALAAFREKVAADNVRHEHLAAVETRLNRSIEAMGAQVRRDIDNLTLQQREFGNTIIATVREALQKGIPPPP